MTRYGSDKSRDEVVLVARILLVILFLVFGWSKLTNYSGTTSAMSQNGLPLPQIAALVAMTVELLGAIALILGIWTRPIAVLLAFYTLATALIGHRYWELTGAAQYAAEINFYKNLSIMGGFLLLYVIGPGKYSVDARLAASGTPERW